MKEESLLPWDPEQLKQLCQSIIRQRIETSKIDFKTEINLSGDQSKAELLKDLSAIANSYDQRYQNYGFIILGAKVGALTYLTNSSFDADKFQASIDELIKHYLDPFFSIHVYLFEDDSQQIWGVILIPPTRAMPHVFVKDIHKRYRGDIYVRRNTVTEKAQAGDFARFFRQHYEEYTYDLRLQINNMAQQLIKLESTFPNTNTGQNLNHSDKDFIHPNLNVNKNQDLLTAIENELKTNDDNIRFGLLKESFSILAFLNSDDISWAIPPNKEIFEAILTQIETKCQLLLKGVSEVILNDKKNKYEDTIIEVVEYLALQIDAPTGVPFNEYGEAIRNLPLVLLLHIVFITGVVKKRDSLLRRILSLNLRRKSHYEEANPIFFSFHYLRKADALFQYKHPQHPHHQWCDPTSMYIKQKLATLINSPDPLWNYEEAFFKGEFVLSLSQLNLLNADKKTPTFKAPMPGTYLYFNAAVPILKRFLQSEKEMIQKIFTRPLDNILAAFDSYAPHIINQICSPNGFIEGAMIAAFPENVVSNK